MTGFFLLFRYLHNKGNKMPFFFLSYCWIRTYNGCTNLKTIFPSPYLHFPYLRLVHLQKDKKRMEVTGTASSAVFCGLLYNSLSIKNIYGWIIRWWMTNWTEFEKRRVVISSRHRSVFSRKNENLKKSQPWYTVCLPRFEIITFRIQA
jgi:hypothetical protein